MLRLQIALLTIFMILAPVAALAQPPDCPAGYYDFGPAAAVLGIRCEAAEGTIVFCKRKTLLEKGVCTGEAQPIRCAWGNESWLCKEDGAYPFTAEITRLSPTTIRYRFQSSFSSGVLKGTKLPIDPK